MIAWQHRGERSRHVNMISRSFHVHFLRPVFLLCLIGISIGAKAVILDPPSLRCASVDLAGDVTLTWAVPPDPDGDFLEYRIYGATVPAGPYALVATVPVYGNLAQFIGGANADTGPRYYYMTTVSTSPAPNESISSDTLATLHLDVMQSTPLGSALLTWNPPTITPTTAPDINIWMEYPIGNWTLVGSVPNTATSYTHVISVCEDSLTFRIGLGDDAGCISYSSRDGDVFQDATPPSSPIVTHVTVDTLSGLANVEWEPSPEGDTDGYIIVLVTPGGGVIIDTLYGQFNTTYEWGPSTPYIAAESFTIAAFDTCQVGDPPAPNTSATRPPHTTMHATTSYDRCAARITLQWTAYEGWDVQSYQILVQVDGGNWSTLNNVPGDQLSVNHDVEPDRNYCYLVKAIRGPGMPVSFSNETCRFTDYPTLPAFNYLRRVTVTDPDRILITDSVDMMAQVSGYTLQRSVNGGEWTSIANAGAGAGPVIDFFDNDVDASTTGYRYRVLVRDSCGLGALVSNIGGNIILQAESDLRNFNVLEWNAYADWAGMVGSYRIHRSVSDEPYELIAEVPPSPLAYTDHVHDLVESTGKFCYMVQAIETGNPSGINATSESNLTCAVQEELVYIPNAFVVGGVNNLFIPVIGYVDVKEYEFSIINRWGQVIWNTNDRYEGWDGTIESQVMPTGIYAYYCTFHNGAGRRFEKRGIVTLLTAISE